MRVGAGSAAPVHRHLRERAGETIVRHMRHVMEGGGPWASPETDDLTDTD
jgi:hypothetical protein